MMPKLKKEHTIYYGALIGFIIGLMLAIAHIAGVYDETFECLAIIGTAVALFSVLGFFMFMLLNEP